MLGIIFTIIITFCLCLLVYIVAGVLEYQRQSKKGIPIWQINGDKVSISSCLIAIYLIIQLITYGIALWTWFKADHFHFWEGFKELLMALCPVINIYYVAETWTTIIIFTYSIYSNILIIIGNI